MIKIIKFLLKDLVSDIKYFFIIIKRLIKGQPIVNKEKVQQAKEKLKHIDYLQEFKTIYPWLIVIGFAFVMGILLGAKYYEVQCNNFIYENYVKPQLGGSFIDDNDMYSFNLSSVAPLESKFPDNYNKPSRNQ